MTYQEMIANESWTGIGKQRRKAGDEEHRIQVACVQWFRLQYPKLAKRLFAVGNGGGRSKAEGGRLKAEGVLAGVSDLVLLKPANGAGGHGRPTCSGTAGNGGGYGALLIEMKTEKKSSRQEAVQKEWEADVTRDGEYKYVVCRSLEEFMAVVRDYLGDPPMVRAGTGRPLDDGSAEHND